MRARRSSGWKRGWRSWPPPPPSPRGGGGEVQGLELPPPLGEGGGGGPRRQLPQDPPCHPQRLPIILRQVLPQPRHPGVHLGPAQLLFRRHLARRGHQQRWPGEERARTPAHHDHDVGEARHVGAARRARAVLHGDHRDARGREARQVAEQAAPENEAFDLVFGEVGARALHQMHEGQAVLQRDLLHAQDLLQPARLDRAGVDARVAGHHHAAHAGHEAHARDHAATGHRLLRVLCVLQVAGQRAQRHIGRTRIQQQGDALARQQLAALVEHGFRFRRGLCRALFERAQLRDAREHGLSALPGLRALGVEGRLKHPGTPSASHTGETPRRA
jgi:hypothetical protein